MDTLWTYITDTAVAWKDWLKDSALIAACGGLLALLIPDFTMPWYGYLCVGLLALLPAGFNTWRKQHLEVLELRALRDAPGLTFECADGPPFHDIVGDKRRPTFSLGIRNSSPFTRRNVRLEVLSINHGSSSQVPIRLRVQHLGTEAADVQPGQMTCFEIAKVAPGKGLLFCRFKTNELPEVHHGTYTLRVAAYADDLPHREALVHISSTTAGLRGSLLEQGPGPYDLPAGDRARPMYTRIDTTPTGTYHAEVVPMATTSSYISGATVVTPSGSADSREFDPAWTFRSPREVQAPVGVRQAASTISSLDVTTSLTGTAVARNFDSPPAVDGMYMMLRDLAPRAPQVDTKSTAADEFGGEAPFPRNRSD